MCAYVCACCCGDVELSWYGDVTVSTGAVVPTQVASAECRGSTANAGVLHERPATVTLVVPSVVPAGGGATNEASIASAGSHVARTTPVARTARVPGQGWRGLFVVGVDNVLPALTSSARKRLLCARACAAKQSTNINK